MRDLMYTDTAAGAMALLDLEADARVVAAARNGVATGTLAWQPDPIVPGVWGIMPTVKWWRPNSPLAIVYCLSGDFEGGEALMEAQACKGGHGLQVIIAGDATEVLRACGCVEANTEVPA